MKGWLANFLFKKCSIFMVIIVSFTYNVLLQRDVLCSCKDDFINCCVYMVGPTLIIFFLMICIDKIFLKACRFECVCCGQNEQEQNDQEQNDQDQNDQEQNDQDQNDQEQNDQDRNDQEQNDQEQHDQEQNDQEQNDREQNDQEQNNQQQNDQEQNDQDQNDQEENDQEQNDQDQNDQEQNDQEQHDQEQNDQEQNDQDQNDQEENDQEQNNQEQNNQEQNNQVRIHTDENRNQQVENNQTQRTQNTFFRGLLVYHIFKAFLVSLLWGISVLIDGDWFLCCLSQKDLACKDPSNYTSEDKSRIAHQKSTSRSIGFGVLLIIFLVLAVISAFDWKKCCKRDKKRTYYKLILGESKGVLHTTLKEAARNDMTERIRTTINDENWEKCFDVHVDMIRSSCRPKLIQQPE